jgi:hypothetical protein
MLTIAAAMSATFYTCPHGTMVGIAGIGFAHSTNGGPCRNHFEKIEAWHVAGDWYVWVA